MYFFTYELDRRKGAKHCIVNAVQPGLVYTDIGLKHTNWLHSFAWKVRRTLWKGVTPAEGAQNVDIPGYATLTLKRRER